MPEKGFERIKEFLIYVHTFNGKIIVVQQFKYNLIDMFIKAVKRKARNKSVRHLAGVAVVGPTGPRLAPKQSGAVEACWAHNPEVRGSKPRSATIFLMHVIKLVLKEKICCMSQLIYTVSIYFWCSISIKNINTFA